MPSGVPEAGGWTVQIVEVNQSGKQENFRLHYSLPTLNVFIALEKK